MPLQSLSFCLDHRHIHEAKPAAESVQRPGAEERAPLGPGTRKASMVPIGAVIQDHEN